MAGLYIHIPFCIKKCPYCDFVSFQNKSDLIDEYLNILHQELLIYKTRYNINFETLYIGGGTPSFLSEKQLEKLFFLIYSTIEREKLKEITIEINPGTINKNKALIITENTNRISIGMQSFNNKVLKILGRVHKNKENYTTFDLFKKSGINNINIDLMYGICGQKLKDVLDDIDKAVKLKPDHISFYLFTIHGKEFKNKKLPDDDIIADMYLNGVKRLKKNKFVHYEISNFALENKFCLHNLNYWNSGQYIGIGVSASSFYNNERFSNTSDIYDYMKSLKNNKLPVICREKISDEKKIKEYIMLKLRTKNGIDNKEFYQNFKFDFYLKYSNIIDKYTSDNFMKKSKKRIFLTEKGFLISNEIIKDFF